MRRLGTAVDDDVWTPDPEGAGVTKPRLSGAVRIIVSPGQSSLEHDRAFDASQIGQTVNKSFRRSDVHLHFRNRETCKSNRHTRGQSTSPKLPQGLLSMLDVD